ncbi:GD14241, partial [Drosophila simulans]
LFSWPTNCRRAKRSPSYGWQLARAFVIGFMLISDEICAMQLLLLLPLSLSVDSCCKLQL